MILETLVIPDQAESVLIPENRYAKMRNVFSIPSVTTLERWLTESGFQEVKTVDITATTPEEQRAVWLRWWRAKQSREAHRRKREAEEAARFPAEEPYLPELLDDEGEPAAHEYEASRERQELRRRLHRRQMAAAAPTL